MNKFMKHQNSNSIQAVFDWPGLLRVVFLMCCLLSAGFALQAQEKKITAEFKDTPLSNVKTTGKTFYLTRFSLLMTTCNPTKSRPL